MRIYNSVVMPSKLFTLARIFIWFYGISTEDKVTKQITLFNINTRGVALHENYIVAGCLVADGQYYGEGRTQNVSQIRDNQRRSCIMGFVPLTFKHLDQKLCHG